MSGNYHITSWTENSDWSSGYLLDPDDDSLMRPRKNVSVAKFFSEVGPIDQHSIFTTDVMQLLTNLILLAHQLQVTSGLRVLDNGLGPAVFGAEDIVIDYALLASDQKASLPSQVYLPFRKVEHLPI